MEILATVEGAGWRIEPDVEGPLPSYGPTPPGEEDHTRWIRVSDAKTQYSGLLVNNQIAG